MKQSAYSSNEAAWAARPIAHPSTSAATTDALGEGPFLQFFFFFFEDDDDPSKGRDKGRGRGRVRGVVSPAAGKGGA